MTTSPLVLTYDQEGKEGGTKREKEPPDRRLFRYWFDHRRSWNIVKLLIVNGLLFRKLLVVQ